MQIAAGRESYQQCLAYHVSCWIFEDESSATDKYQTLMWGSAADDVQAVITLTHNRPDDKYC